MGYSKKGLELNMRPSIFSLKLMYINFSDVDNTWDY